MSRLEVLRRFKGFLLTEQSNTIFPSRVFNLDPFVYGTIRRVTSNGSQGTEKGTYESVFIEGFFRRNVSVI